MSIKGSDSAEFLKFILLLQFAATWAMVGLIWFVQIVHYPLFPLVGSGDFKRYHLQHSNRTSWVVGPPMLVELLTAGALVFWRPAAVSRWAAMIGFLLVIAIWVATASVQVPLHNRLAESFEPSAARRLVATNWLRTLAWSLRGCLTVWMVWKVGASGG